jgi:hypothetical protein
MDTVQQAAQVMAEHAFMTHLPGAVLICLCDWRSTAETAGEAHRQHRQHLAQALTDAGLLAVREKSTPLDQLAPGNRIWLDGAWREVGHVAELANGDIEVALWNRVDGFTAPAALLVRRAET